MLRSLHTVSSRARHAIQPHLLSIQFLFYAVLFIKRRQSPTLRKNALSYTHPCTVSWNATIQCNAMQCNAMQCNAMQCNAMAQPNARKNAMSCSVPCMRCPRALAMPSSRGGRSEAQQNSWEIYDLTKSQGDSVSVPSRRLCFWKIHDLKKARVTRSAFLAGAFVSCENMT